MRLPGYKRVTRSSRLPTYSALPCRRDPAYDNYEWASKGVYGDEVISIPFNASFTKVGNMCTPNATEYAHCYLNIAVYGSRASNYSIVLTTSSGSESLLEGIPTVSTGLLPGDVDYFNFSVPQAGDGTGGNQPGAVTFRLSPGAGAGGTQQPPPQLLVSSQALGSARPDPSNPSTYCTSVIEPPGYSGAESVTIYNSSACACPATGPAGGYSCTYYAAVYNPPSSLAPAPYTLVATTSATAYSLLLDGSPVSGAGSDGGSGSQFMFNAMLDSSLLNASGAVEISVTPSQGTVILYVTLGASFGAGPQTPPGPGINASQFQSSGGPGSQSLSISPGDPRWASTCGTAGTGSASSSSAAPCQVYIGVWTTSLSSSWSVVARASAYMQLTPGLPQTDMAQANSISFYRFRASVPGQQIIVSAASISGNPSLFIGCDSNNATTRPTGQPGSFIWSAVSFDDEVIEIDPSTDANACSAPCNYYIGITSADTGRAIGYTILARTNSSGAATPLILGEVILDVVQPGQYNRYTLPYDLSAPTITISAYTSDGNVNLFGTLDNSTVVTASNAAYSAGVAAGTDEWEGFTVTMGDSAWNASSTCVKAASNATAAAASGSAACTVFVGVYGNTTTSPSQYFITASADVRQVSDGIAIQGNVGQAPATAYYRYTAYDASPFTVTLTPLSGDPDLLLSFQARPNITSAQWTSRQPAAEFISVQWTEPWIDPRKKIITFPADFYIGVTGWDDSCAYTLVVDSMPYTQLSSGIPQAASTTGGLLQYFILQVPAPDVNGFAVGFSATISPLSGDTSPIVSKICGVWL